MINIFALKVVHIESISPSHGLGKQKSNRNTFRDENNVANHEGGFGGNLDEGPC